MRTLLLVSALCGLMLHTSLELTPLLLATQADEVPDQVVMSLTGKRPMNMAISPDGKVAAINVSTGEIFLCDAHTGDQISLLRGHSQ